MEVDVIHHVTLQEILPMRIKVLRPTGTYQDSIFPGDHEQNTSHLAWIVNDEILGTGTVIQESEAGIFGANEWRIRGMAVDADHRKKGIGKNILAALLEHVNKHQGHIVWCNARTPALSLYKHFGFKIYGDEFTLPDVGPHYRLRR